MQDILKKYECDTIEDFYYSIVFNSIEKSRALFAELKTEKQVQDFKEWHTHFISTDIEATNEKETTESFLLALSDGNKYVLQIENGKFVSEIYTITDLDFETMYKADAKKFDTIIEAKEFLKGLHVIDSYIKIVTINETDI